MILEQSEKNKLNIFLDFIQEIEKILTNVDYGESTEIHIDADYIFYTINVSICRDHYYPIYIGNIPLNKIKFDYENKTFNIDGIFHKKEIEYFGDTIKELKMLMMTGILNK